MATFTLSYKVSGEVGGEAIAIGGPNNLQSVTASAAAMKGRIPVAAGETITCWSRPSSTDYDIDTPVLMILIPSVTGTFYFYSTGSQADNSVFSDWTAGVPLIIDRVKTTAYSAVSATRASSAEVAISAIVFISSSTEAGHMSMYGLA